MVEPAELYRKMVDVVDELFASCRVWVAAGKIFIAKPGQPIVPLDDLEDDPITDGLLMSSQAKTFCRMILEHDPAPRSLCEVTMHQAYNDGCAVLDEGAWYWQPKESGELRSYICDKQDAFTAKLARLGLTVDASSSGNDKKRWTSVFATVGDSLVLLYVVNAAGFEVLVRLPASSVCNDEHSFQFTAIIKMSRRACGAVTYTAFWSRSDKAWFLRREECPYVVVIDSRNKIHVFSKIQP